LYDVVDMCMLAILVCAIQEGAATQLVVRVDVSRVDGKQYSEVSNLASPNYKVI
jgi:hypothetical protein